MTNLPSSDAEAYLAKDPAIQQLRGLDRIPGSRELGFAAIAREVHGPLREYIAITSRMGLDPSGFPRSIPRDDRSAIETALRAVIQDGYAYGGKALDDEAAAPYVDAFFEFIGEPVHRPTEIRPGARAPGLPNYSVYVTFEAGGMAFDDVGEATFERLLVVSGLKEVEPDTWLHYLMGIYGSEED